jgi:hypothetical protein
VHVFFVVLSALINWSFQSTTPKGCSCSDSNNWQLLLEAAANSVAVQALTMVLGTECLPASFAFQLAIVLGCTVPAYGMKAFCVEREPPE